MFVKSPPLVERERFSATHWIDAYNAQTPPSLRPIDAQGASQHERQLLATGLEEGCDEPEETWQGLPWYRWLPLGDDFDQCGVDFRRRKKCRARDAQHALRPAVHSNTQRGEAPTTGRCHDAVGDFLLHQQVDPRRRARLFEQVGEQRARQVVWDVAGHSIRQWQEVCHPGAQDVTLDDPDAGMTAKGKRERLDASGVALDADDRVHAAGQLDGQRPQAGADLDDVLGARQLQGVDDQVELLAVGDEILSPAPLIPNPEAARHAADDRGVGEVERSSISRRGSTERARSRSAGCYGRSRRPLCSVAGRFVPRSRRCIAARWAGPGGFAVAEMVSPSRRACGRAGSYWLR